jgi:hypothetical protein
MSAVERLGFDRPQNAIEILAVDIECLVELRQRRVDILLVESDPHGWRRIRCPVGTGDRRGPVRIVTLCQPVEDKAQQNQDDGIDCHGHEGEPEARRDNRRSANHSRKRRCTAGRV